MLTEQGFDYTPVFMFGKITTTPTTVVSALFNFPVFLFGAYQDVGALVFSAYAQDVRAKGNDSALKSQE